MAHYIVTFTSR